MSPLEEFINVALSEFMDERVAFMKAMITKKGMIKTGALKNSLIILPTRDMQATLIIPYYFRFLDMNLWRAKAFTRSFNRIAWGVNRKKQAIYLRKAINSQYKDTRVYNKAIWGGLPDLRIKLSKVLVNATKEEIIRHVNYLNSVRTHDHTHVAGL